MTKTVRIENADTNQDKKVVVEVMAINTIEGEEDTLVARHYLNDPTAMSEELLHSGQYLVIREADKESGS